MNPQNPPTTPKERFRTTPALREAHEKYVTTTAAEIARDTALLEYMRRQSRKGNVNESWDEHSKLVGAQEVLEIFFALHLPEQEMKRERLRNLPIPE
jgi:hypothetical protein